MDRKTRSTKGKGRRSERITRSNRKNILGQGILRKGHVMAQI